MNPNTPLFPDHVDVPQQTGSVSAARIIIIVVASVVGLFLVGSVAMAALGSNVERKFAEVESDLDDYDSYGFDSSSFSE